MYCFDFIIVQLVFTWMVTKVVNNFNHRMFSHYIYK